jgi:hypothetical protein
VLRYNYISHFSMNLAVGAAQDHVLDAVWRAYGDATTPKTSRKIREGVGRAYMEARYQSMG